MKTENAGESPRRFLACERKGVYTLLMLSSGMMGAYTYNLRGGVFCNAQTANILMMGVALGKRNFGHALYYLIPLTAYFLGAFVSEALPSPVKRAGFLRWDTLLIALEMLVLFLCGLIPLTAPPQFVQVAVNFIASMQYNTFRQAEGVPMATTFCTNHVRQVGIACARIVRKKDAAAKGRALIHIRMLAAFAAGALVLTAFGGLLKERASWLILIPLGVIFANLVYADLFAEHGEFSRKPSGH